MGPVPWRPRGPPLSCCVLVEGLAPVRRFPGAGWAAGAFTQSALDPCWGQPWGLQAWGVAGYRGHCTLEGGALWSWWPVLSHSPPHTLYHVLCLALAQSHGPGHLWTRTPETRSPKCPFPPLLLSSGLLARAEKMLD